MGARAAGTAEAAGAARKEKQTRRARDGGERAGGEAKGGGPPETAVAARAERSTRGDGTRRAARGLAALAAALLCVGGGVLVGYWVAARPLRGRLADSRAAERRLAESNRVLRARAGDLAQQIAEVPGLRDQIAALEQQKQQLAQRNARIIANTRPLLRSGLPLLPATPPQPKPLAVQVRPLALGAALPPGLKGAGPGTHKAAGGAAVAAKPPATAAHPVQPAGPHPALASVGSERPVSAEHAAVRASERVAAPAAAMALLSPVGASVATDRPSFSWRAMAGAESYVVIIYDASGAEIARSPALTEPSWTPARALPRGQTFQWEVVAYRDGQRIGRAPTPPAPSAKFTIAAPPRAAGAS